MKPGRPSGRTVNEKTATPEPKCSWFTRERATNRPEARSPTRLRGAANLQGSMAHRKGRSGFQRTTFEGESAPAGLRVRRHFFVLRGWRPALTISHKCQTRVL